MIFRFIICLLLLNTSLMILTFSILMTLLKFNRVFSITIIIQKCYIVLKFFLQFYILKWSLHLSSLRFFNKTNTFFEIGTFVGMVDETINFVERSGIKVIVITYLFAILWNITMWYISRKLLRDCWLDLVFIDWSLEIILVMRYLSE